MGKKSRDVLNFLVETFSGEMGIGSHFKAAAVNFLINFTIFNSGFLISMFCWRSS